MFGPKGQVETDGKNAWKFMRQSLQNMFYGPKDSIVGFLFTNTHEEFSEIFSGWREVSDFYSIAQCSIKWAYVSYKPLAIYSVGARYSAFISLSSKSEEIHHGGN